MEEQGAHISELGGGHPDRREPIVREQFEQQGRVASIVFLPSRSDRANFRRMTHMAGDPELLHQAPEPPHRSGGFDPHDHRRRQAGVKIPHHRPLMFQRAFDAFTGLAIQHRDGLLRSV